MEKDFACQEFCTEHINVPSGSPWGYAQPPGRDPRGSPLSLGEDHFAGGDTEEGIRPDASPRSARFLRDFHVRGIGNADAVQLPVYPFIGCHVIVREVGLGQRKLFQEKVSELFLR